jgi:hypothetical protein
MNPTLRITRARWLHALATVIAGRPAPAVSPPRSGTVSAGHLDVDLSDLCESRARPGDPDVALCKLSLTRDDAVMPRPKRGPLGFDFDPVM